MNYHDEEAVLEAVREALNYVPTAEEQIERKIDGVVRDLDELMALANNPETIDLVEGQKIGIGQIVSRAQLIQSFLLAQKPRGLRMVSNNGR